MNWKERLFQLLEVTTADVNKAFDENDPDRKVQRAIKANNKKRDRARAQFKGRSSRQSGERSRADSGSSIRSK